MAPGEDASELNGEQRQSEREISGTFDEVKARAEASAAKGDFADATKCYEQLTSMEPTNGAIWTSLGHSYLLTDKTSKAFNSYQQALRLLADVHDPQLWYGIGLLYDKVTVPSLLV